MIYRINPVPKPRMTQSDKWKKRACVMRYRDFKDQCRCFHVKLPEDGARVIFHIQMPKSWSEKKKGSMAGRWHKSRPDLSNLLKALEDAIFTDDSKISSYGYLCKRWARRGAIEII